MKKLILCLTTVWLCGVAKSAVTITHEVPIHIGIYADTHGTRRAITDSKLNRAFELMNERYYHPHGVHLYMASSTEIRNRSMNLESDFNKLTSDGDVLERPFDELAAYFNLGFGSVSALSGQAFTNPDKKHNLSFTRGYVAHVGLVAGSMAHEVGHTLGLDHLYRDGDPIRSFENNPDNRMAGGNHFAEWQMDIVKASWYAKPVSTVPEPSVFGLLGVAMMTIICRRRRVSMA